jgi:hypothetical protein
MKFPDQYKVFVPFRNKWWSRSQLVSTAEEAHTFNVLNHAINVAFSDGQIHDASTFELFMPRDQVVAEYRALHPWVVAEDGDEED